MNKEEKVTLFSLIYILLQVICLSCMYCYKDMYKIFLSISVGISILTFIIVLIIGLINNYNKKKQFNHNKGAFIVYRPAELMKRT